MTETLLTVPAAGTDPRVDLGSRSVVRGDPFVWTLTFYRTQADGSILPEDLTVYGDIWSAVARSSTFSPSGADLDPTVGGDDSNELTLTLSGAATALISARSTDEPSVAGFDVTVSGGDSGRDTAFKGTLKVYQDWTRVATDATVPPSGAVTTIVLPYQAGDTITIIQTGLPGRDGEPGPPGAPGAGVLAPESVDDDGGDALFDWGDTIRGMQADFRRADLTADRIYCFSGPITVEAGGLLSGAGGSAASTNPGLSTLRALDSTAMVWLRGAGPQLRDVHVDGDSLADVCVKVGGTDVGDAGTSPVLDNVTAQLAATGGKNFWISGSQNGRASGCNSLYSGGEDWSITDSAGGWKFDRCEGTSGADPNLHIDGAGNLTFDTCIFERDTDAITPNIVVEGTIPYGSIRFNGCTGATGGAVPGPTVIATGAAISAAGDTVTITGHGLFTGCPIQFSNITGAAGLTAGTIYYLVGKTANTFQVAATAGGSAVNITSDGTADVATVYRYILDHHATGTVKLNDCQFGAGAGEIGVGVRGGIASRLMVDGATYYTGAGMTAFLDYDSAAVIDFDGQPIGQIAGLTVGTVPLRTDRSPAANIAMWRRAALNIFRSLASLRGLAFWQTGDTTPRLEILADGTHKWSNGTTVDTTLAHGLLSPDNVTGLGLTTPFGSTGDNFAPRFRRYPQGLVTLVADAAVAIDCAKQLTYVKLSNFNCTSFTLSGTNAKSGQSVQVGIKQGGTTAGTVTFGGFSDGIDWVGGDANKPVMPTTLSAWLFLSFEVTDNGRFVEIARSLAPIATGTTALTDVGVRTANYSPAVNTIVRCNPVGGGIAVTLPTTPAVGSRVVVKKIDASANTVTIAAGGSDVFNVTGGSTSLTLAVQFASVTVQYMTGIWIVTSTDSGAGVAYLASPALTGNPTAPTQSAADNSTKLATTAYTDRAALAVKSRRETAAVAAGLITENVALESVSSGIAPAAGTAYGFLVGLLAGDVVTNLCVVVSTVGAGTAPTLIKLGLADPSGNVVALTANVASSSSWTAAVAPVQIPLSAPYTVPTTGGYRVVLLQVGSWGTTQLALGRTGALVAAGASSAIGSGIRKLATYGTGLTDLPAVSSALASSGGTTQGFWVGCS